ncbi:ornithine carbamoyltransferase [Polycladomyces sp. WAk]|uniref:Ornithine carbamoyltransferase n=1 Tax=Polycladomyces zharkentensis TaxID=2807616 RepID=A0ABS2WEJ5_9BACL|nr:ornithine carbamoyltransferase [Polycladomyces sp. WAk]
MEGGRPTVSVALVPVQAEPLKGRDCLSLADWKPEEIELILDVAQKLKEKQRRGERYTPLAGKTLAMIFDKPSTRTRVSFETGIAQLGGYALSLNRNELQLGRGETIADTARVLSRYVDGILIRTFEHRTVIELARYAEVPVINGLTDLHHPCQVLADLLTLREKKGSLVGLKLAFVGDGNNVAHSLLHGCAAMGVHISVAAPEGYQPLSEVVEEARQIAKDTGAEITITTDPAEAVQQADAVYTDVWASMGQEEEKELRKQIFGGYQVDAELMSKAKPDAVFLHCLPAYRGWEVTADVLDGPQSVVWDQAENRLHAQKALMLLLMG